jgi:MFS transporter, PPP family, 3-phenylpropionic acid transporter
LVGSRLVLPAAAGGAALAAGLLVVVSCPAATVVAVALLGAATGGVSPVLDALALQTVAADRNRYGRLRVWGSASFIVSVVIVGALVQQTSIRGLFIVLIASLAATALVGLGLRSQELLPSLPRLVGVRSVVGSRVVRRFLLAALLVWSATAAINSFFSIRLVEIGASESLVGIAWALGAVVEIPVMAFFPALAARIGLERLLLIGGLLFVVRAIAVAVLRDPVLVTLTMTLHGAAFALMLVGGVSYVSHHAPPGAAATAQGLLSAMTFGLAVILGPGLGGLLAPRLGLPGMFLGAAVASVVGMAAVVWVVGSSAASSTARPAG